MGVMRHTCTDHKVSATDPTSPLQVITWSGKFETKHPLVFKKQIFL